MSITFDFFLPFGFLFWSWLTWILFILFVLTYLFLILGSRDLKRDNYASTKLLFVIGILLLVWYILIRLFIPSMSVTSPTPMEFIIYIIYTLFLGFGIIYQVLHIILGIGFIKVGSSNRDHGGTVALVGGILYLIAWTLNMLSNLLLAFIPVYLYLLFTIIAWLIIITNLVAAILIFIFSIFTKRPLFIVFGALFLAVYSFQFLLFIGII